MSEHTHGEYEISENQKRYFTPTTKQVRKIYADYRDDIREGDPSKSYPLSGHEFDRWLAEIKAQAWEEGYTAGGVDAWDDVTGETDNPYREGEPSE